MCGIAGIVDAEPGAQIDAATLQRMCLTLIHRGPDDEGFYVRRGVGLGMRRLSIIDLAGGHQPIHNEDQTIWIVFNGEIYNFLELRTELESRGHRFYTHTDTEVIVHLYEDHGAECVQKLRGMFAFAVYDERRQSLLLARDRLGIKPLYYANDGNRLLFGSEIKAILAAAPELRKIDPESLLQYFYLRYIPDPCTAFSGIHKLPPGHVLEFSKGASHLTQYWDLPSYGRQEACSDEECLEELEHRLAEAVRIRLIADVPLGALLSGGTDSSTIVALMARLSSKPVKTFSIIFRDTDFSEAHYARAVAERFQTEHHELLVDSDLEQTLALLTSSLEEPFGDSSMLPTYHVCRMARQHVTVALSGDGGDEIFAGYERYHLSLRRRNFDRIPAAAGRWYREQIYPRLPRDTYGRTFLFNVSLANPDRYFDYISVLAACDRDRSLFSDDFLASTSQHRSPFESFRKYYDHAAAYDPLSRLLYLETKTTLPGDMLTKVDRMSMAASLEVRVPLLDHLLVEWVTGLPVSVKTRNGAGKHILRKLAERLGVPRKVLYRPKQGFALPLVHWLRREMKDELPRLLLEPRTLQRGYFNPRGVRELLDEHFRGRRDHSSKIWLLLIFELWHRNFLEASGDKPETPLPVALASRENANKLPSRGLAISR
jgi:asparagine synthase (glutamine-hydrolysing)